MRLVRELKQAQIECAYAQHWVMLTKLRLNNPPEIARLLVGDLPSAG